jgi:hypothetical protein
VLTLRVPDETFRRIAKEARRRRRTRSAIVREVLKGAFGGGPTFEAPVAEARRQSLLVSGRPSERDALRFIEAIADTKGWR